MGGAMQRSSSSGQYVVFADHSRSGVGTSLNDSSAYPAAHMTIFRGQFIGLVPLHRNLNAPGTPATTNKVLVVHSGRAPDPLDVLPASVRRALPVQSPCEATFGYLAEHHPEWLVVLVQRSALKVADLTFAAEAVGRCKDSTLVRVALQPLLRHASPVVREGAIYGIANHLDLSSRRELERLAGEDASPGVRAAATDALTRR